MRSASVLGFAIGWEPSDIADADGDGILTCAVGTNVVLRSTDMDGAITIDNKVITYLAKASSSMPTVDVGYSIVHAFLGG